MSPELDTAALGVVEGCGTGATAGVGASDEAEEPLPPMKSKKCRPADAVVGGGSPAVPCSVSVNRANRASGPVSAEERRDFCRTSGVGISAELISLEAEAAPSAPPPPPLSVATAAVAAAAAATAVTAAATAAAAAAALSRRIASSSACSCCRSACSAAGTKRGNGAATAAAAVAGSTPLTFSLLTRRTRPPSDHLLRLASNGTEVADETAAGDADASQVRALRGSAAGAAPALARGFGDARGARPPGE